MAIIINAETLGSAPAPVFNLAFLSGIFGSMPAGEMGVCPDANTALIGWEKITPDTQNHPSPTAQYGTLWTIDTMGCGNNGIRRIPVNTIDQEWVNQLALMNDGTIMMRQRINKSAWGSWVRWL
ncbi:hypothetical protein QQ154_001159 [Salmonella enterica]|nr:hypothetical protein [Salmonella enterica]